MFGVACLLMGVGCSDANTEFVLAQLQRQQERIVLADGISMSGCDIACAHGLHASAVDDSVVGTAVLVWVSRVWSVGVQCRQR